jgi:uncharacterized protein YcaQ
MTLADLRRRAARRTLFAPRSLAAAVAQLGFVQIDPLRAPARAQDLILRQRVAGYRAGDLDRAYRDLGLVEDFVHVHGVLPAASRRLLHPRAIERTWQVEHEHPRLGEQIVEFIARNGPTHPKALHAAFGRGAVVNGWGGRSVATTRMLEVLHYRGRLHVSHRADGIKVYAIAPAISRPLTPRARALGVLALLLRLYAPLPLQSLRELARMAADASFDAARRERLIDAFVQSDGVAGATVDGVRYLWPADDAAAEEARDEVRLLAPFDPLVWDRRRFAHLHDWDYRFEAYTPAARRRFGYYALPLLWRDRVVGWANVRRTGGELDVQTGFPRAAPRGKGFARALDAEIARLAAFLPDTVPAGTP